MIPLTQIRLST